MDKNVYISKMSYIPTDLKGFCKLKFELFDRNQEKDSFTTSSMTEYNAKKYEKEVLNSLGYSSFLDMFYGINPEEFATIKDENTKAIVGLQNEKILMRRDGVTNLNPTNKNRQEKDFDFVR